MSIKNLPPEEEYLRLRAENIERMKELACINQTTSILKEGKSLEETLQQVAQIMPRAWQYPEYTSARIVYDGQEYKSPGFRVSPWQQQQLFITFDNSQGSLEVYYSKEFPTLDEGPFMKEEKHLLSNLAALISSHINAIKGQELLRTQGKPKPMPPLAEPAVQSKKLLQQFLNKSNVDRDIYHDLMPFKVKEILLVANLYDAYSIEKEGRFSEHVLGEYAQLNLSSMPRITGVSTGEEALEQLFGKHFDLVIIMLGADKRTPITISEKIKTAFPYIPVFLLLNNNSDVAMFEEKKNEIRTIDRIFVWNGESKIFFAMIKLVEDKINAQNDTEKGLVRIILLVEDSPQYYSLYLPILYQIVMEQTKRIIDDVSTDILYRILKLRARPKILLASDYEEAVEVAKHYGDYLLCLITDVAFSRAGKSDENAGFNLVKYIRKELGDLPVIMQSSENDWADRAYEVQATFINKNSETLVDEFNSFIQHFLGFGNFIYRDMDGNQVAIAHTLKEFEYLLRTIPDESVMYHARKNNFSMWLMARGEIQAAKILNPKKVSDFKSAESIRQYLIDIIQQFRNEQNKGKVIPFEESAINDETNIVSLSEGLLGGKGRGLAFINNLIYNYDFSQHIPNINLCTPKTSIIGTEEFEMFMERNKLQKVVLTETGYERIKKAFVGCKLSDTLIKRLKILLKHIQKPLAVRSSGLFEDSLMQPFAGIFETYLLPNNHPDINVRLGQLMDAIKLVYASVYSDVAREYIRAVNYKIEQEKMAVVIQEVVGARYEDYYYPHISGVAQSYNYYPFAHMKPEEGYVVAALGLGKYVVEGAKAYRFSPKYPTTDISSPADQYKNSQVDFIAVDLKKKEMNLLEGDMAGLTILDLEEAERHGNLKHCASVFNPDNNTISPGTNQPGPRVVNFANILKYNYIPLAKTIEVVLDTVKEALGCPVEIEFAVDLNRDKDYKASFHLLQIKPLIGNAEDYNIDFDKIEEKDIILLSERSMGNGLIKDVKDLIYVDTALFDKSQTEEMAREVDHLNGLMVKEGLQYVLIGPGRWGTRDRWIGIPVNWAQISNARIIIETSLEGFPLDASSGSHFFHNVTSMNVGYFSINAEMNQGYIKWDFLRNQPVVNQTKYFKHVRFDKPLMIRMDGKQRKAVITLH